MKNILLILGNITFHHFTDEEKALFTTGKEQKALIHELYSVQLYDDKELAYQNGDDAESYILFPDFEGELVFENEVVREKTIKEIKSLMPISELLAKALKL